MTLNQVEIKVEISSFFIFWDLLDFFKVRPKLTMKAMSMYLKKLSEGDKYLV